MTNLLILILGATLGFFIGMIVGKIDGIAECWETINNQGLRNAIFTCYSLEDFTRLVLRRK